VSIAFSFIARSTRPANPTLLEPNQLIVAAGENDGLLTFRRLAHRLQIAHQHLIEAVESFAAEQMSCDLLRREETFQGGQDRGGTLDEPNAPPHKLFN
jgi:hypothetical protein